ncbi:hypothetical protein F5J12DRAFT_785172 [Pisolithus orientalis]|uniref:uncharacterized protein n=1 Tax=Pisolithus orientalis TaxID=936130 RepID=UPI00222497CC|nr:uncharacterized protein F5J12DRAFT_785172 [Pisolithus orientalis]KAI5997217.1 hypothetical protein F5J12DRAFT_785172 [Pisolithus orientalis]
MLKDVLPKPRRSSSISSGRQTRSEMQFPSSPASLLIKRSRTRATKGLWEEAIQDANEEVKADPSSPWGYEATHVVLHGAKQYDEAIEAFKSMLHRMDQSHDPATTRMYLLYETNTPSDGFTELRKNYISPPDVIAAIDSIVGEICCPLVVIDVTTGCLCNDTGRMRIFKADTRFKGLVSSMTKKVDRTEIRHGNEPSFQDVNVVNSVWDLPDTPLNNKLHVFRLETRRFGHNWAWSYTCCIDKSASSVLNQSLTSMYKWNANSAATLVFLAGVTHPPKPGDLSQFLSPNVIFFYDSEWKPYFGNTGVSHKQSPGIMQERADAIKIPSGTIVTFFPDNLGVREKLRFASTRNAKFDEDVAYSLIGIFTSDIRPHYGEGSDALGHLLEEIVARNGEVTVLACQIPYDPSSLEGAEMKSCIAKLRSLEKPCGGNEKLYLARVSGLGEVEFTTIDQLPLNGTQKFAFAHPWIDHTRGLSSGVTLENDSESDPDSDLDCPCTTG